METIKEEAFVHALMSFVVVIFFIGVGVILLYAHFQKNLLHQKLKQETLKNLHQQELLRSNIETQEEERRHIAQDLHDELGAMLSIMKMNLLMMERKSNAAVLILPSSVAQVRQLSEAAMESMRRISHRLMPPQLEAFGLFPALQSVIDQINASGRIQIRLEASSFPEPIAKNIALSLYRILMELINNTLKHAEATEIIIDMALHGDVLQCRYSDNGKGLAASALPAGGMGQKSIEARVSALSGSLIADQSIVDGYCVQVDIPLSNP